MTDTAGQRGKRVSRTKAMRNAMTDGVPTARLQLLSRGGRLWRWNDVKVGLFGRQHRRMEIEK